MARHFLRTRTVLVVAIISASPQLDAQTVGTAAITEFTVASGRYLAPMANGPDQRLWTGASDSGVGSVLAVSPDGTTEGLGILDTGDGIVAITRRLSDLWFTLQSGRVGRITVDGVVTLFPLPSAPYTEMGGIVAGPDGNLWIGQPGDNAVTRMTPLGSVTQFQLSTEGAGPNDLAVGADGNIWFVENGQTTDRIGKITPSGEIVEFELPRRSTPTQVLVALPFRIAAGSDGNIWFTELEGNRIGRITTSGILTEFDLPTPSSRPFGITAGPDGGVWFAEQGSNRIGRISSAGEIVEFHVAGACPENIVTGPDGNIWFTQGCGLGKVGRLDVSSINLLPAIPALSRTALLVLVATLGVLGLLRSAV